MKGAPDYVCPKWPAMFAMAGNESFTTKEQANVGNRLTRRTIAFHFSQRVAEQDRSLDDSILAEMDKIIVISSWALRVRI